MKKTIYGLILTVILFLGFISIISPSELIAPYGSWKSLLLKTGQTTSYFFQDDGDQQKGVTKAYTVNTNGSQNGTVNVDSPHYAAATISFTAASNLIVDSANGLATVLLGDTIRIRGSGSNNSVLAVTVANGANNVVVDGPVVTEAAGNYVTICKRATHSNNTVLDTNTGLTWARYVQTGKIGPASDGKLNWYDTATCFILHAADAHVAMIAGNILRIDSTDQSARFFAGQVLVCSGFTNNVNMLPGLVVVSVSYTGGNTDIIVSPGNQTLIAEAAGGNRDIKIVCQSIFSYCLAANVANLGGYGDWRVPNMAEANSLAIRQAPATIYNTTAFPVSPSWCWSSTTVPNSTTLALYFGRTDDWGLDDDKTVTKHVLLIRGG